MTKTYTNPKDGKEIRSALSRTEAKDIILNKENRGDFANSLCAQYLRLSASQQFHFFRIAEEIKNPQIKADNTIKSGEGMAALHGMFIKASEHLKKPEIRFQEAFGLVSLSLAKAESKNPNHIYIKFNGEYCGKISPDGTFSPVQTCLDIIKRYIENFSGNPVAIAKDYGRRTGNCCFCRIRLTTRESLDAGYGPVCAEHYGLPWG
jgi:hypothetical protein